MPSRIEILKLYKNLLREADKFEIYNYRMYALRRIKDAFRDDKTLTGEDIEKKYLIGISQLNVIKRQVIVGNLYRPPKLVIEE